MYFFKNTAGNWILGPEPASLKSKVASELIIHTPTNVSVSTIEKKLYLINRTDVTAIKKNAEGDFYANYAEFVAAVSDFFDNAPITAEEVDAKIGAEVDILSDRIDTVENIANASIGGYLGSIKPTDPAPTPARNGNYTFSIGGTKPAWLTAEAGVTTVKAGDGVAVVYTAPSSYTYTHVDIEYSIEQSRSQSTSKVPSSKLVDDELNKKIDSTTAAVELSKKINKVDYTKETKIKDLSDGFYVTDLQGNVMFKILVDGASALAYKIIDNTTKEVVATLDKAWLDMMYSGSFLSNMRLYYKNDSFYYTDPNGYVIAKITKDGVQAIKFLDKNGDTVGTPPKKLQDKKVVSLGDSHRTANWLSKFCELTGAINSSVIDAYIQANEYSYNDTGLMVGQARALKQYCTDNSFVPDLILIENCHYGKGAELITDYIPQIYNNFQTYGTTFASYQALTSGIEAAKTAFIASLTPTLKTALRFNYNTYKETLTFGGTTLNAGTITLTINGSNFAINVTQGMTLSQAVTDLNDWAFGEYLITWNNTATKGATRTNTIELIYTGISDPTEPTVSFNGGTTGMTYTSKAMTSAVASQDYYYNSLSLANWNDSSKWIAQNGTNLYPSFRGLIEYLIANFPNSEIIVWGVQFLNVSQTPGAATSYLVETSAGSGVYVFDIDAFYANTSNANYYRSKLAMKEVATYYNLRFLDVDKECGISPFNMFTNSYYAPNNLHPLTNGYNKWGETLAKLY